MKNLIEVIDSLNDIDSHLLKIAKIILGDTDETPVLDDKLFVGDNDFFWFYFSVPESKSDFSFTIYNDGTMYLNQNSGDPDMPNKFYEPTARLYNALNVYKYLKIIGFELKI